MCLQYDKEYTNKIRKKLVKNKYIRAYKVLRYSISKDGEVILYSPYFNTRYDKQTIASNRKKKHRADMSDHGIHVCLTKRAAKRYYCPLRIVVEVVCTLNEFIAAGNGEALMNKIYIDSKEYTRVMDQIYTHSMKLLNT